MVEALDRSEMSGTRTEGARRPLATGEASCTSASGMKMLGRRGSPLALVASAATGEEEAPNGDLSAGGGLQKTGPSDSDASVEAGASAAATARLSSDKMSSPGAWSENEEMGDCFTAERNTRSA